MSFCATLAFLLIKVFKFVEPVTMSRDLYLSSVVPIGALYSLSLWLSNSAYIYLSVSFIQMLKALMPVAVYSIGVLFKREGFKTDTMVNMLSISFGVAIAAYGEARFDSWGVFLQLGAVAFEATRLVLIQILLTSKGITLNPITSLYYVAPCCLVFLFVPWIFVEYPVLKESSSFHFDFVIFGTNSLCAFALNLAVFLLVGKTSALTMNVAGVVKDVVDAFLSVIKDTVTQLTCLDMGLRFLGVAYYNHAKLQALKAKEAQKKAQQADEETGRLLEDREGEGTGKRSFVLLYSQFDMTLLVQTLEVHVLNLVSKLEDHCEIVLIGSEIHYRRFIAQRSKDQVHYFWPLENSVVKEFEKIWCQVTDHLEGEITSCYHSGYVWEVLFKHINLLYVWYPIGTRKSEVLKSCHGVGKFIFEYLCCQPQGVADYIAVVKIYQIVFFISDFPTMRMRIRGKARRFITLIDESYNHRCCLFCSTATSIDDAFQGTEEETEGGRSILAEGTVGSGGAPTSIVSMLSGQEEMFALHRADCEESFTTYPAVMH
ncbi:hypothetical protein GH714_023881 [Hevea brasiliensis]|uniref:Sugar phosphate transporter domain-containing protein n=1 Tax=Hevea brasiliensis TaxID=3981 RepID=A0A6A6LS64_HEVBR|nr:hypothetical protein GH714_023881 [Hevea brasiliensis]